MSDCILLNKSDCITMLECLHEDRQITKKALEETKHHMFEHRLERLNKLEERLREVVIVPEQYLSDDVRNELKKSIADAIYDGSFGDGQEREMAWEGGMIVGADEMSDDELIEYCVDNEWEDEDIEEAIAQRETHKMLKGE